MKTSRPNTETAFEGSPFNRDESAVSPVIVAVVLFAVVLAAVAVLTMFVGAGGDEMTIAPTADFEVANDTSELPMWGSSRESSATMLTIRHDGGDEIESENILIRLRKPGDAPDDTISQLQDPDDGYVELANVTDETRNGNEYIRFRADLDHHDVFVEGDTITIEAHDDGQMNRSEAYDYSGEWGVQIIHGPSLHIVFEDSVQIE